MHCEAQTETFLEELTDRAVEVDSETQTEPFRDRPPSPLFVPSKTGQDKATEIGAEELFDFNSEVGPILEVLVGKTLRISMLEVMEEEELEQIRQRQREFEQMRNAELMEVQRLDAQASRRFAEKQRRLNQERERIRAQTELQEKVAARAFAKSYLVDLSELVFEKLEDDGHFYDPVTREVETVFMPWLMDSLVSDTTSFTDSRSMADDLIKQAIQVAADTQADILRQRAEAEAARLAAIKKAEEQAEAARLAAEEEAAAAAAAAEQGEEYGGEAS